MILQKNNAFKSFKYKTKLVQETVAQLAPYNNNGIIDNATICEPLKHLRNFLGSLQIPLINFKAELKIKWKKHCVLAAAGVDNISANDIIFAIKETKLYVLVIASSAKDNQKLSKRLSKGFGKLIYWNEYKIKIENKNTRDKYRYFRESNFAGVSIVSSGLFESK